MDKYKREDVILGAFLHDIGKFWWRTNEKLCGYESFTEEDYGKNGAHAKWSAEFISRYLPDKWKNCASLALYHHAPKSPEQELIADADALSAGIDRDKRVGDGKGDPKKELQLSLLETIFLPKKDIPNRPPKKRKYFHKLNPLSLKKEAIFPYKFPTEDRTSEYSLLWEAFIEEVQEIKTIDSFNHYLGSLYYLLHKYTWCIPSAGYVDYPDIPLFDHLRTTAAIATCLFDAHGKDDFLLIEGDLSGIQDFIYKCTSPNEAKSGTAKRLRGRSFYISLLTRTLSDFFLRELNLPLVNSLWCSAGHFCMLAPNTTETANKFRDAEKRVFDFLWKEFKGDINLTIAKVGAIGGQLKKFSQLVGELGFQLSTLKNRKQDLLFETKNEWKLPLKAEVCPVCGIDEKTLEKDGDGNARCKQCQQFEDWGALVPCTKTIIKIEKDVNLSDTKNIPFRELGIYWVLGESAIDTPMCKYSIVDNENIDFQFLNVNLKPDCGYGFYILANYLPRNNGKVFEFDELADSSEGANFLGVLRMDVDNLGAVFTIGLEEKDRSISRIASISRTIDLFFSGYINCLAEKHGIYITYSGGDDLFVVGAWNRIVDLSEEIQKDFKAYCCQNPHLNISGGIYLCKGKFPISRAAELAGIKLNELAKGKKDPYITQDTCNKNSLALFEKKIPWAEFSKVKDFADKDIIPRIKGGVLSRGFIYAMLGLYRQHIDPYRNAGKNEDRYEDLIWVPKFLYIITRNIEDISFRADLQSKIIDFKDWIPVISAYVSLRIRR